MRTIVLVMTLQLVMRTIVLVMTLQLVMNCKLNIDITNGKFQIGVM